MSRYSFNEVKFYREKDYSNEVKKSYWSFFIPGVNSGSFTPSTLHIQIRIKSLTARLFGFKRVTAYSDITLDKGEFDALYDEMTKIKTYRDAIAAQPVNQKGV